MAGGRGVLGAIGAVYAIFRTTRGMPMRSRALAMFVAIVLPLMLAVVLESRY